MAEWHPHLGREAPDYALVKNRVAQVIAENSIIAPPIKPRPIAIAYGLRVLFAGFPESIENISGLYDVRTNEIIVNREDPASRQTFTIAHELGHFLLHKELYERYPEDYRVLSRAPIRASKDPLEQEANAFAAHLLVPRKFLDQYRDIADSRELSRLFIVSEEVIRYRLQLEYGIDATAADACQRCIAAITGFRSVSLF